MYVCSSVMSESFQLHGLQPFLALQSPLPIGFSSSLSSASPGDLPNLGIDPYSLSSPAFAGEFFTTLAPPGKPPYMINTKNKRK